MAVEYLLFQKNGCPSTSKKRVYESMKDGYFRDDILLIQHLDFYHLQWLFPYATHGEILFHLPKKRFFSWKSGQ